MNYHQQAHKFLQALDLKALAEWGKENGGYTLGYLRLIEQKAKNGTLPETTSHKVVRLIKVYLNQLLINNNQNGDENGK